jgi:hypothetical protein
MAWCLVKRRDNFTCSLTHFRSSFESIIAGSTLL